MSVTVLLTLLLGLVLLVVGAEALVRGASRLAAAVGVSPIVIGLTVVAFGTSSPEMAVSARSALAGNADVAIGNVVGSNGFNLLLILGISAVASALAVHQRIIRLDVPVLLGATVLMWLVALDGTIARIEGVGLFALIVTYTVWAIRSTRQEPAGIVAEFDEAFAADPVSARATWLRSVLFVLAGLALLVVGADRLVVAATAIAEAFGVSDLVIGLTIVAAGTSLPELATSVVASIRGERDIAVGNVIGSNIFNILAVLGASAAVAPSGLAVAPGALSLDIPFALLSTVSVLPALAIGLTIRRWEGALLVVGYIAYVLALFATGRGIRTVAEVRTPLFLGFVALSAVLLLVGSVARRRGDRSPAPA